MSLVMQETPSHLRSQTLLEIVPKGYLFHQQQRRGVQNLINDCNPRLSLVAEIDTVDKLS